MCQYSTLVCTVYAIFEPWYVKSQMIKFVRFRLGRSDGTDVYPIKNNSPWLSLHPRHSQDIAKRSL